MEPVRLITSFLLFASFAGILGALAMTSIMRLLAKTQWARGDMIIAVGSLLTRSRDNAFLVGCFMHLISAIFFGVIYTLILLTIGMTDWPEGFFVGAFFGVFHGLVVSLSLCWVVADQHPVEEFQQVGFSVAVTHFIGHMVYGAVVGFVIAVAPI